MKQVETWFFTWNVMISLISENKGKKCKFNLIPKELIINICKGW